VLRHELRLVGLRHLIVRIAMTSESVQSVGCVVQVAFALLGDDQKFIARNLEAKRVGQLDHVGHRGPYPKRHLGARPATIAFVG
jgi:hypothetical protein